MNLPAHKKNAMVHIQLWRSSPSNFNGKEKDRESGFHYYGARYYWSEVLTGWLSVDPMADKYPGISPYAYCTWNPVLFIDPYGEEKLIWFDTRPPRMAYTDTRKSWAARQQTYEDNIKLKKYGERFSDRSDVIHVFAHGEHSNGKTTGRLFYNGEHLNAISFTRKVLVESKTFTGSNDQKQCVIMLHCCYSGQGESSFAQQLSYGNNLVIAPSDKCSINVNSNGSEFVDNGGVWNVFLDGEKLATLSGDESTTKDLLTRLNNSTPAQIHDYFKKLNKNEE